MIRTRYIFFGRKLRRSAYIKVPKLNQRIEELRLMGVTDTTAMRILKQIYDRVSNTNREATRPTLMRLMKPIEQALKGMPTQIED